MHICEHVFTNNFKYIWNLYMCIFSVSVYLFYFCSISRCFLWELMRLNCDWNAPNENCVESITTQIDHFNSYRFLHLCRIYNIIRDVHEFSYKMYVCGLVSILYKKNTKKVYEKKIIWTFLGNWMDYYEKKHTLKYIYTYNFND